MIVKKPHGA